MAEPVFGEAGSDRISGEVYEIDDQTLRSCDHLEGHPHFYIRKEIEVWVLDGSGLCEGEYRKTCWAYFIQPPFYNNWKKIKGGLWQPSLSENLLRTKTSNPSPSTLKAGSRRQASTT
jgi:gamma-glutamylcyclotransferase (GGCT)/AIG2-like uncharacterized protein YtfP